MSWQSEIGYVVYFHPSSPPALSVGLQFHQLIQFSHSWNPSDWAVPRPLPPFPTFPMQAIFVLIHVLIPAVILAILLFHLFLLLFLQVNPTQHQRLLFPLQKILFPPFLSLQRIIQLPL